MKMSGAVNIYRISLTISEIMIIYIMNLSSRVY